MAPRSRSEGSNFNQVRPRAWRFSNAGTAATIGSVDFGTCPTYHINATMGAAVWLVEGYSISGDSAHHYSASVGGLIDMEIPSTVMLVGERNFTWFAVARVAGVIDHKRTTFVGRAKGRRFVVYMNGLIPKAAAANTSRATNPVACGAVANMTECGRSRCRMASPVTLGRPLMRARFEGCSCTGRLARKKAASL
jgi:hypothetical protein